MGEITDALLRSGARPPGDNDSPTNLERVAVERTTVRVPPREITRRDPHPVSREKRSRWIPRAVLVEATSPIAEQYRQTAVKVRRELLERKPPILLVTSPQRGEGKTTTTCNLALALASIAAEQRIALVGLDLRRPTVAQVFGRTPKIGIETVLAGQADLSDVVIQTDSPALDVFPAATASPAAHELLSDSAIGELFRKLTNRYGLVICDTPPVLPVPDVPLLAGHAGACLLVARAGMTRRAAFRAAVRLLPREKMIGSFLNDAAIEAHSYDAYTDPDLEGS